MKTWWDTLPARARAGLLAGVAATLLLVGAAGWWLLRGDPAVLFSDLRPQDASLLAGELEKLKIPYAVADNGATLLVDRAQVHAARLKLMGRDLPLHGSVGFELFNTSDFGMTEFAQKINYQRALQGELTRTILSFPEVRDARVHLALPEQGLFRQNTARPKAAITLSLRPGHALRNEQVSGIQRLVAAAVPGLLAQEVTLVDQQGVALTRPSDAEPDAAGARLDLKRELENYLSRKAALVLEKVYGAGQALASVDLTLNMDQVRVTTEDVLAAPDARGGAAAGVLVRERESARDSASPDVRAAETRAARGSSMQREVEYQAGRRVEQVVSQPGAVRRIQVVAVVRQALTEAEKEQLHRLVGAAVGASAERGDTVVIQSLQPEAAPQAAAGPTATAPPPPAPTATGTAATLISPWGAGVALLVLLCVLAWALRRRGAPSVARQRLTRQERQQALLQVQAWMLQAAPGQAVDAAARSGRAE